MNTKRYVNLQCMLPFLCIFIMSCSGQDSSKLSDYKISYKNHTGAYYLLEAQDSKENSSKTISTLDIDKDGFIDIIVSDTEFDGKRGRVEVTSGADGSLLFSKEGEGQHDGFGSSVAVLDIDDDGNDDLIIGAHLYDGINKVDTGKIYIFSVSDDSLIFEQEGEHSEDYFGFTVLSSEVCQGELNDVVVGAPGFDGEKGIDTGKIYFNFTDMTVEGDHAGEHLGETISVDEINRTRECKEELTEETALEPSDAKEDKKDKKDKKDKLDPEAEIIRLTGELELAQLTKIEAEKNLADTNNMLADALAEAAEAMAAKVSAATVKDTTASDVSRLTQELLLAEDVKNTSQEASLAAQANLLAAQMEMAATEDKILQLTQELAVATSLLEDKQIVLKQATQQSTEATTTFNHAIKNAEDATSEATRLALEYDNLLESAKSSEQLINERASKRLQADETLKAMRTQQDQKLAASRALVDQKRSDRKLFKDEKREKRRAKKDELVAQNRAKKDELYALQSQKLSDRQLVYISSKEDAQKIQEEAKKVVEEATLEDCQIDDEKTHKSKRYEHKRHFGKYLRKFIFSKIRKSWSFHHFHHKDTHFEKRDQEQYHDEKTREISSRCDNQTTQLESAKKIADNAQLAFERAQDLVIQGEKDLVLLAETYERQMAKRTKKDQALSKKRNKKDELRVNKRANKDEVVAKHRAAEDQEILSRRMQEDAQIKALRASEDSAILENKDEFDTALESAKQKVEDAQLVAAQLNTLAESAKTYAAESKADQKLARQATMATTQAIKLITDQLALFETDVLEATVEEAAAVLQQASLELAVAVNAKKQVEKQLQNAQTLSEQALLAYNKASELLESKQAAVEEARLQVEQAKAALELVLQQVILLTDQLEDVTAKSKKDNKPDCNPNSNMNSRGCSETKS